MADFSTPQKGGPSGSTSLKCHVFAGSKGGTGKTSVLFHAAAQYAADYPRQNVLVVDCSFAGDVSERLLGGAAQTEGRTAGEAAFENLYEQKKSATHLFQHLYANMAPSTPASEKKSPFMAAFRRFSITGREQGPDPLTVNIVEKFGVPVEDINPRIGLSNLFLVPGGAKGRQPCAGLGISSEEEKQRMATALSSHLEALPGVWRVFFDTDGDMDMSTSMHVVIRACNTCALFTETDPSDFRRVRVFVEDLFRIKVDDMKIDAIGCAGIAVVCFNKVAPDPKLQPFEELGCSVKPHMVAVRDLVASFANKLSSFVLDPRTRIQSLGLFTSVPLMVPGDDEAARIATFKKSCFMVMQEFKKAGILGSDLGIPFCCIDNKATYTGEHGVYTVDNEAMLLRLIENVRELNSRL